MNPKPNPQDPTRPAPENDRPVPSTGPLKNEPTPERARVEKERQEERATRD